MNLTKSPTPALLQELKADTNAAIVLTTELQLCESINWNNLSCREASFVMDDSGRSRWRVLIEEAAPEATKFCELIRAALELRGWQDVEVVTEW